MKSRRVQVIYGMFVLVVAAALGLRAQTPLGNSAFGLSTSSPLAILPMVDQTGTTVTDYSGKGNHCMFAASPNNPSWTGWGVSTVPAGTLRYISCPNALATWQTFQAYVCFYPGVQATGQSGHSEFSRFEVIVGDSDGNGIIVISGVGSPNDQYEGGFAPALYSRGNSTWYTWQQVGDDLGGCGVISVTRGGTDHIYWTTPDLNTSEITYGAQGNSNGRNTSSNVLLGGAIPGSRYFNGTFGFAYFDGAALSSAAVGQNVAAIIQAVQQRPGVPVYPSPQLYTGNRVLILGDSLTAEYRVPTPWSSSLSLMNSYDVQNFGYFNNTAKMARALSIEREQTMIPTVPGRAVAISWLGTNDVCPGASHNFTPAQAWANLTAWSGGLRSKGVRTVVMTMISRNTGGSCDSYKNSLNTLIRQQWPAYFDAIADIAAVPSLGADGAYSNSTYFLDMAHITQSAATNLVAPLVSQVINAMDGATPQIPNFTTSNSYIESVADNYLTDTPTAAATLTLPDCLGFTGWTRTIYNASSSYTITVSGINPETITGNAVIPPGQTGRFQVQLTSPSTAGCYWLRIGNLSGH
jgi:hypothetical protein